MSNNLVELLRSASATVPDARHLTFLENEVEVDRLSFSELDADARAIAVVLREAGLAGKRVVLLYPPGLDYVRGLFGCFYAGVVAVPAYPPHPTRLSRTLPRLLSIVDDCQPAAVLTTTMVAMMAEPVRELAPHLVELPWIVTSEIQRGVGDAWRPIPIAPDSLAFLQYTSGSTADPRGVMLTHANILANEKMIMTAFGTSPGFSVVGWLPTYHDMGLIGNILQTLYARGHLVMQSPLEFLAKPITWLRAITKYRAAASGGPNFAYDLCVRKTSAEDRASLDLSSWKTVFNGAEPLRRETFDRFLETFAIHGLQPSALTPCYGLAEAALLVSGQQGVGMKTLSVSKARLAEGKIVAEEGEGARVLVGSGPPIDQDVRIVDPTTSTESPADTVGEIWISGANVALGYWGREAASKETFGATLPDAPGKTFLRSGDLGFLHGGELFVTGRSKDVIIIRGLNHYPHDIERVVEASHPLLRPGCGAAFAIDEGAETKLVVVHEIDRRMRDRRASEPAGGPTDRRRGADRRASDPWSIDRSALSPEASDHGGVFDAVRSALSENLDLRADVIVLLNAGQLPKTSSGKVMRRNCRDLLQRGELDVFARWDAQAVLSMVPSRRGTSAPPPREDEIVTWLSEWMAQIAQVAPTEIEPYRTFAHYGLDSRMALGGADKLATWLGRPVAPTMFWEYPSILKLARYLSATSGSAPAATPMRPIADSRLQIEDYLDRVDSMSDSEIAALLTKKK